VSREDLDDEDLEAEQGLIACVIHKMHSDDTAAVRNLATDHSILSDLATAFPCNFRGV
jgi:hypothetical protein